MAQIARHKLVSLLCVCRHPFFRKNLPLELQTLMQDQGAAFAAGTARQPRQSLQDLMLVLSQARVNPADGLPQ